MSESPPPLSSTAAHARNTNVGLASTAALVIRAESTNVPPALVCWLSIRVDRENKIVGQLVSCLGFNAVRGSLCVENERAAVRRRFVMRTLWHSAGLLVVGQALRTYQ